jgi:hypothetical protein
MLNSLLVTDFRDYIGTVEKPERRVGMVLRLTSQAKILPATANSKSDYLPGLRF